MRLKKLTLAFFLMLLLLSLGVHKVHAASNTLSLNHNSYVYDNKGKRVGKTVIKKNKKIVPVKKVEKINKEKKYFIFRSQVGNELIENIPSLYWLPYKKIKDDYYYQIGSNKFIKCINVKKVGSSFLYTSDVKVKIKKGWSIYADDDKGETTNYKITANKKYTVDREVTLPKHILISYRIKGTKYWINSAYVADNPRQWLLSKELVSYPVSRIKPKIAEVTLYDREGKEESDIKIEKTALNWSYESKELLYIWNSQKNKAELYYQLLNQEIESNIVNKRGEYTYKLDEGYVKVDDMVVSGGNRLIPSNTPEQAKAVYEASLKK